VIHFNFIAILNIFQYFRLHLRLYKIKIGKRSCEQISIFVVILIRYFINISIERLSHLGLQKLFRSIKTCLSMKYTIVIQLYLKIPTPYCNYTNIYVIFNRGIQYSRYWGS